MVHSQRRNHATGSDPDRDNDGILDNEDVTAGKQFIHHEHRAVQEC